MTTAACPCWASNYSLGHDGHCCFLHDDRRTWRADDDVCHVPEGDAA